MAVIVQKLLVHAEDYRYVMVKRLGHTYGQTVCHLGNILITLYPECLLIGISRDEYLVFKRIRIIIPAAGKHNRHQA